MAGLTNKKPSRGGAGCLAIFGLPFAGVGVVMTWLTVSTITTWQSMQSWEEVPAEIVAVDLEVNSDDDSTTYRCTAQYAYEYNGQSYTSTRVAIGSGSDNIGSFHQDAYNELVQFRDSGQPFRCFVNPSQPSESVLYRDLRWGMLLFYAIFIVTFGGVGFGLVIGGLWSLRKAREVGQLRVEHVDTPWLWKPEWAEGAIHSSSKAQMGFVLAFATFWNVIALPISFFVIADVVIQKGDHEALFVLIFPAIGLLLALWAVYAVLKWLKYGDSVFRMAEVPGVIGGKLSGVVEVAAKVRPDDGFHLALSCINRVTTGSGKSRSTTEHVLWQDTRTMAHELSERDPTATSIPIAFGIPYDSRETDGSDSNNEIVWRLEVKAATPGVDYQVQFEVPVFKTEASSPDFVLDETPLAPYLAEADPLRDLQATGVQVTPLTSGGVRVDFPPARNKSLAMGTTIFFFIWTAVVVAMFKFGAPIFLPIIFGAIDFLLLWGVLNLWFASSRVEAKFQVLEFSSGLFGGRNQTLYFEQLDKLETAQDLQAGGKLYYSIKATTTDGKTHTLAKHVEGLQPAQALVGLLSDGLAGSERKQ